MYSHCTRVFSDKIIKNIRVSLWPLYLRNSHKYNIKMMWDNFDNVYTGMIAIHPVFEALVRRRKMETSVCTPLMNSCIERFPSWFLSIFMKISFVFSSAERPPLWDSLVILYIAWKVPTINVELHLNIHLVLNRLKLVVYQVIFSISLSNFRFFAISVKSQNIEYVEIISCIIFLKKLLKSQKLTYIN